LGHLASEPRPWLAVLGTEVDHSLSPRIHNAALRKAGRLERFAALNVPQSASALRLLGHVAPRLGLVGASVTAPLKVEAARVAQTDDLAKAVGAANCLRWAGDRLEATNTDATALLRLLGHAKGAKTALVLGAGGAARAAVWALARLGIETTVASRTRSKAEGLLTASATWVPWGDAFPAADIVVQATPLDAESPVTPAALARRPLVVELNYAQGATALQKAAEAAHCNVVDGRAFLVEQAIDAFRYWFGQEPDVHAMRAAVQGAG
jgi:shikimate dehydrogenase